MIKKILIAVAFPLTLKAQTDSTLIADTVRFISPRHLKVMLNYLPKEWTIGEAQKVSQFVEAVIRAAAADFKPKQTTTSK